ncbi:hypothetical protein AMTR_s00050p00124270 [Amborella trichopoda]|uniref:Uncharacterized protein n=1 Tax=Amborella trichopoda TaxID=13333 RepID=W1PXC5_AMBTC|nr:hypothetical protein AMTR_s00050p00124270 [Amborella trichopoda]
MMVYFGKEDEKDREQRMRGVWHGGSCPHLVLICKRQVGGDKRMTCGRRDVLEMGL